ncbi:hypothetical protein [Candidatus Jordarchaeum sp.]|uniref:hypothetical protein n=1 Tax=Candidatus Jordarchaeum sp. TaxID=2823881 RepID=UPI004049FA3E
MFKSCLRKATSLKPLVEKSLNDVEKIDLPFKIGLAQKRKQLIAEELKSYPENY